MPVLVDDFFTLIMILMNDLLNFVNDHIIDKSQAVCVTRFDQ